MRQLPHNKILNVVHSLWISKLRYGLQLCTKVRLTNEDTHTSTQKEIQLTQNRLLRLLNGTKIKDKVSIHSMLQKFGLLSVNQLAAKIKLIEVWKTLNRPEYPIELDPYKRSSHPNAHELRTREDRIFDDSCKLKRSESSFHVDSARLWNASTPEIRQAKSLNLAKKAINVFCKALPI